jgi:ribosomal protein S18 acetylase RimI-like enzyme
VIRVRRATSDDAAAIATVHVHAWQAAYARILPEAFLRSLSIAERTSVWHTRLQERPAQTYVAEHAAQVIGWAVVGRSREADAPDTTGELWAIYVAPEHWGTGAGRALWTQGRTRLEALGCLDAVVWVLADNQRARRFYERVGFAPAPDGTRTIEIGGTAVAEVRLRCRLGAAKAPR